MSKHTAKYACAGQDHSFNPCAARGTAAYLWKCGGGVITITPTPPHPALGYNLAYLSTSYQTASNSHTDTFFSSFFNTMSQGDMRRQWLTFHPWFVVTGSRAIDTSLCLRTCSSHPVQSLRNETILSHWTSNATVFSMANTDNMRGTNVALVSWVTSVIMFFAVAIKLGTRMLVTKSFGCSIDGALILAAMVSVLLMSFCASVLKPYRNSEFAIAYWIITFTWRHSP